jgi:acyl CoA:acetate/3-ketoacid CoA transferase
VEEGELDPEMVVTPGSFIDRIVKIPEGEVGSAKQKRDLMQFIMGDAVLRKVLLGAQQKEEKK